MCNQKEIKFNTQFFRNRENFVVRPKELHKMQFFKLYVGVNKLKTWPNIYV